MDNRNDIREGRTGVYILLDEGEPVYVGQGNIASRIRQHVVNKKFDKIRYMYTDWIEKDEERFRLALESALIRYKLPKYNNDANNREWKESTKVGWEESLAQDNYDNYLRGATPANYYILDGNLECVGHSSGKSGVDALKNYWARMNGKIDDPMAPRDFNPGDYIAQEIETGDYTVYINEYDRYNERMYRTHDVCYYPTTRKTTINGERIDQPIGGVHIIQRTVNENGDPGYKELTYEQYDKKYHNNEERI